MMRMMLAGAVAACGLAMAGCSAEPKSAGDKAALTASTDATLASFRAKDPSLNALLDKAVGWAVFPDIGKAGFVIGGSYGRGEVFEGGRRIGYADVTSGSFGLQAGAQSFSQLVIFLRQSDLDAFKTGNNFSLEAAASAVALTAGAAAKTDPSKGVVVFVDTRGGLMAEAAIAGQVLGFKPL